MKMAAASGIDTTQKPGAYPVFSANAAPVPVYDPVTAVSLARDGFDPALV